MVRRKLEWMPYVKIRAATFVEAPDFIMPDPLINEIRHSVEKCLFRRILGTRIQFNGKGVVLFQACMDLRGSHA
jgi:hypothetical protein